MRGRRTTKGKFLVPYEYLHENYKKRLNPALTVFCKEPATTQIYICSCIDAGRTSWGVDRSLEMRRLIVDFLGDESGATAIEYCLIAAGISIVIVVVVNGMGTTLSDKFVSVNASIK